MMNKKLMNQRLKIALFYLSDEEGFVMPIAVGFGLVMLIIALTMIIRSQGDVVSASSQKTVSGALAAAETGITYYQGVISKNKAIAVYPDCISRSADGTCSDTGSNQKSWYNASAISELSSGSSSSAPCGVTITSGNTAANTPTEIVQKSTTNWQDITDAIYGVNQGQFKLVSYSGVPNNTVPGNATLTVIGRVKQSGTGNTATYESNTATTKLVISIPVSSTTTPGTSSGISPTGLWATDFDMNGAGATSNANVMDSSCGISGNRPFPVGSLGTLPSDGTPAQIIASNTAFPTLPNNGVYQAPTTGNYNTPAAINLTGNNNKTFPSNGDRDINGVAYSSTSPQNGTYVYNIASIRLAGNNTSITFGTASGNCQQTIKIYVDGNVSMNAGTVSPTTCGSTNGVVRTTKVIFYLGPNATLSLNGGASALNPNLYQFYVYGAGSNRVTLSGGITTTLSAFVFAPFTETIFSGQANLKGTVWTKSFRANGGGTINQGTSLSQNEVEVTLPNPSSSSIQTINLGNVNSWQRQSVN